MRIQKLLNVGFGAARVGLGVVAGAYPEKVGRTWIGEAAVGPESGVILRALAVRDLALGAGTVEAALRDDARIWIAVSTMADLGDVAATLIARKDLPRAGVLTTTALAGSAAITGIILLAIDLAGD
ncbi:MAG: hypothetical protein WBW62_11780 [Solirubrobacterales bacterium]